MAHPINTRALAMLPVTLALTAGKDCSVFLTKNPPFGDVIAYTDLGKILEVFIVVIIIIAGIWAFFQLALGGFQYITSSGEKLATQNARERITYAILGLALVAGAFAFTQILGAVFGINILGGVKFPGAESIVGNLGTGACK